MPVAVATKVEALARDFRSQRKLADALGVSPAQIGRWMRGQGIDELNAERVEMLELVMANLLRMFEPEAARAWLFGINAFLRNTRPIDAIRMGQFDEVLAAVRQTRAGSFA